MHMMNITEAKKYFKEYLRLNTRAQKLLFEMECYPEDKPLLEPLFLKVSAVSKNISNIIDAVPDVYYRDLLRRKYIDGATLEELGEEFGYSARHIQRMINTAVGSVIREVEKSGFKQ